MTTISPDGKVKLLYITILHFCGFCGMGLIFSLIGMIVDIKGVLYSMAETEKMTINIDVVDLGKIDLLVDQGFYSNRTDLIKTSIRNELLKHEDTVKHIVTKKSYNLGVTKFTKDYLEQLASNDKVLDVKVMGLLIIDEDVTPQLVQKTIKTLKVMGAFKAKPEIKALFN